MHLLLIYVLFVGLPLLGIVGLLEAGRNLRAPRSVSGKWEVRSDLTPLAHTPCADLVKNIRQPALTVLQSGPVLAIAVNNESGTMLSGRIDQSVVTAGIGNQQPCFLKAELAKPKGTALTGVISVNCSGCQPVPFQAVKMPPVKSRL